MIEIDVLAPERRGHAGYKVDVTRSERVGWVSSEWFSRPADERFLSLSDLFASVNGRAERSRTRTVESAAVRVEASCNDAERLTLVLPGSDAPVAPTHWSFGQLASLVGAPGAYLRQFPASLAGINLQYGLSSHRAEQVKTLESWPTSFAGSTTILRHACTNCCRGTGPIPESLEPPQPEKLVRGPGRTLTVAHQGTIEFDALAGIDLALAV